jgi:hypothetical protein
MGCKYGIVIGFDRQGKIRESRETKKARPLGKSANSNVKYIKKKSTIFDIYFCYI